MLSEVKEKKGPAAVLVDEYDKPMLDVLTDIKQAALHRDALHNFYGQIKAGDASTKFVFVTGITKFSKTGVFSTLNNLKDIPMKDEYATMLGYTYDELILNFDAHIDNSAEKMGLGRSELLEQIRDYYDGFSFDGINRLYNPFSTLNFFDDSKFKNYWFDSGSPAFLVNYVKEHGLDAEEFRGKIEHEDFTSATEIELAKPSSFLFQSGYLTVRERDGDGLVLDYPNKEVLSAMSNLFMYSRLNTRDAGEIRLTLEKPCQGARPRPL